MLKSFPGSLRERSIERNSHTLWEGIRMPKQTLSDILVPFLGFLLFRFGPPPVVVSPILLVFRVLAIAASLMCLVFDHPFFVLTIS
jgi:hypothetical protein